MLQAYFDEVGTSGNRDGVFAVCGYVAPESEWESFGKNWGALLRQPCHYPVDTKRADLVCRPLDYLQAQEMEGLGKGRFRRLGQRNRDHLIQRSVTTVIQSGVIGIGSMISLPAYAALTNRAKNLLGDPYYVCLQAVIIETAQQAGMFLCEDPSEDIAYIFEKNPIWELTLHDLYNQMLAKGLGPQYRMGTITFAEKKKFVPLQAADRLCYEIYKHFTEHKFRPQFDRLRKWPQNHGRYFDKGGMNALIEELKNDGAL